MTTVTLCSIMLVVFFAIMIFVGFYTRRHTTDVNGFVLGGRSVGPWLTAFAFGTSYFSAVIFVGYAGQFWMEFWTGFHMGRSWKCLYWFTSCMERIRKKNKSYDTAY